MKLIHLITLVAVSLGSIEANAKIVRPTDSNISFEVSENYTPLTAEEIAFKFPTNGPAYAVGNEKRNTTIAYKIMRTPPVNQEYLTLVAVVMGKAVQQAAPTSEFLANEVVTINGRKWIHYTIKSQAIDSAIINEMYLTDDQAKLVGVNINTTEQRYPEVKNELANTVATLRVLE